MSVYFVATYDITDPTAYAQYPPLVAPLLRKHGAEVVVADAAPAALEGAPRMTVVLRFPSEHAARAFYDDPAYVPVEEIRLKTTRNGSIVLAKQYVPAHV
jgi:uncharacterized protein (DUF1330 family)